MFRAGSLWSRCLFSPMRRAQRWRLVSAVGAGLLMVNCIPKQKIALDSRVQAEVLVDKGVRMFPTKVEIDGIKLELLGTGTRSVSFLGFKVYAVGLYIATDDIAKAKQLLSSQMDVEGLMDKAKSEEVIHKLLAGGIRFDVRIVPVRNTDFGHLRDGFVRAVASNKRFKEEAESSADVGAGLNDFKKAFSGRRSVKKGEIIHLTRLGDGSLRTSLYDCEAESECKEDCLGAVNNQLVSEFLFLKYLGGDSPSSPEAQANATRALASLLTS